MSTSSVSGGNMINVQGIVSQLMAIEQQPLTTVTQRISSANVSISAMGEVRAKLDAAYSAAAAMESSSMLTGKSVASADSAIAKATVSVAGQAGVGEVTIANTQLARAQRTTFSGFSSSSLAMGAGTGSLQIAADPNSTLVTTGDTPFSVSIDLAGKTLAEIRNEINDHEDLVGKVTAALVNTGVGANPWILQISGAGIGASATFTATLSADESVIGEITSTDGGVTPGSGPAKDAAGTGARSARNAQAEFNGVVVQSESNNFSEAVPGLKVELLKESTAGTSLSVTDNRSELQSRIKQFASSLSDLLTKLRDLTKPGTADSKPGALAGNSGVLSLTSQLLASYSQGIRLSEGRAWLNTDGTEALDANGNARALSFSRLGVSITRQGLFTVDESALSSALSSDLGSRLLVGFSSSIKDTLNAYRGSAGSVQSTIQTMQLNLSNLRNRQSDMQEKLERTRTTLLSRYAALDAKLTQMSQMNSSVSNALASLKA
jgi:flagellar hook-associated protein 2